MPLDRLAMLERFVAERPSDPFPHYGLAMELRKRGRHADARAAFDALLARHPAYIPAYLMAGNNLVELGDRPAAAALYDRGIAAAAAAGDDHALGELQSARAALS